jgi:phenylalanyl-tRNA synthetase beta chain
VPKSKATKAKARLELPEFMPLRRDFAFLAARPVEAGAIVKAALAAEKQLVTEAAVFDVYEGQGVPLDQKSVAITVTIQPRDKTMTDTAIEAVMAKIIAEVTKRTGAVLRG